MSETISKPVQYLGEKCKSEMRDTGDLTRLEYHVYKRQVQSLPVRWQEVHNQNLKSKIEIKFRLLTKREKKESATEYKCNCFVLLFVCFLFDT